MDHGALDIHDAAAWDDSALVAAYDAAIEKYEETHGGVSARTTAASRKHAPRAARSAVEEDTVAGSEAPAADAEAEAAEAARLEAWARYYESQQPAPQAWTPAPGPAAGSSTPPWGASAPPPPPPQFLPGATAPPAVAAAAAAAAATAVSGAPSDQHEADLTNLILAWYHTGFFTAVYQERHGRR